MHNDRLQDALDCRMLPNSERTWLDVARDAAHAEGVALHHVLSRSRSAPVARARHRAWAELRAHGYSYPWIGEGWGYDHTSVMAGVRAHVVKHPGFELWGRVVDASRGAA